MSTPDPLRAALAALAEETRKAEAALAALDASGAPIAERLAAAADVHAARVRSRRSDATARRHDAREAGASVLAGLFEAAAAQSPADPPALVVEEPPAEPDWTSTDAAIAARRPAETAAPTPQEPDAPGANHTPEETAFLAALNASEESPA